MAPSVYIIAGPNGAGKTTFAQKFLPDYAECRNFVNADLIAQGLSPFSPEAAAFHAGRVMLEQIESYARRQVDFGFETTLSGLTCVNVIRRLRELGYAVHIFFLWVPNADIALSRVRERVLDGGHDIPELVVRRRYHRSIENFLRIYRRLTDFWTMFDNSLAAPRAIALEKQRKLRIIDGELYEILIRRYGAS